jgi:glycerol-3-phosphate dehydrogenase (NAD(P)+)
VSRRVAVLGAGSWGTALAIHLARSGREVALRPRRAAQAAELRQARENRDFLPGHRFPDGLHVLDGLEEAIRGSAVVLFVAPAQASRALFREAAPHLGRIACSVIASKGLEESTLLRMSEVFAQETPGGAAASVTVLSGPSFAAEVARGDPTAVVVAGASREACRAAQEALSAGSLRVYRNGDLAGVEIAGALKNVIAIACGIVEGIGFGANTRAAVITRGMAEIARLGAALGGRPATFAGLAGAGDLILTCTGALSRNRALGLEIGRGRPLEEVLRGLRAVAEGVPTTRAAVALAERHGIELPIARQVHDVLFGGRPPRDAVADLLARPLKDEA